jgi:putative intracellular protease/amidase
VRVLIPLPDRDFDVTEVAVPWRVLTDAGHELVFATERGEQAPRADPRLLDGVLFGKLGAYDEPKRFYRELTQTDSFRAPIAWTDLRPGDFDALLLPGGHAPGMRQYLSSVALQNKVIEFWRLDRPVGAICHGVLVLARAKDPVTGRSVIADRRTTCLPKYMERSAYYLTAWRLGRYYRTYPAYVEDEVRAALAEAAQFFRGPRTTRRGTATDYANAFVVQEGAYLSARWPGDAYLFANRFRALIEEPEPIRHGDEVRLASSERPGQNK